MTCWDVPMQPPKQSPGFSDFEDLELLLPKVSSGLAPPIFTTAFGKPVALESLSSSILCDPTNGAKDVWNVGQRKLNLDLT